MVKLKHFVKCDYNYHCHLKWVKSLGFVSSCSLYWVGAQILILWNKALNSSDALVLIALLDLNPKPYTRFTDFLAHYIIASS